MAKVVDHLTASRSRAPDRVAWLAIPMALVLAALYVFPLAQLLISSFSTASGFNVSRYAALLSDGGFLQVILRTLRISVLVCLFGSAIGYPIAYAAVRAPKLVAASMLACVTLPLFTSTLVRSYAWRALLADNGLVNEWLIWLGFTEKPLTLIFNDTGIVIGMTQVLLPLMVLPIYASMRNIDLTAISASRSMGATHLAAWRTIFLPQSSRGLAAGVSLVFISSLGFYTTPALLGGIATPMFAQLIDIQINTRSEYGPTTAEAALVLLGVILLLVLLRKPLGLTASAGVQATAPGPGWAFHLLVKPFAVAWDYVTRRLGGGVLGRGLRGIEAGVSHLRWLIVGTVAAIGIVILVGPQLVILLLAFNSSNFLSFPPAGYSGRWFASYLSDDFWLQSTQLSFLVSIVAAGVSTLLGTLGAFAVVRMRRKRLSVSVYMLGMAPLVMPPILYAVGLFFVFVTVGLVGTAAGLIVAYSVLGIPYVLVTAQAVVRDIDPLMERAAASLGASVLRRTGNVVLPLMVPAVIASFLLAFIHAFDDLVMAVFLGSASTVTLEMRMYQDIQFEISPKVAAVGVLVTLTMLFLAGATVVFNRHRDRYSPESR